MVFVRESPLCVNKAARMAATVLLAKAASHRIPPLSPPIRPATGEMVRVDGRNSSLSVSIMEISVET